MTSSSRGPAFLILLAALMAAAGNGISIVAFPWLVLQRDGSARDASIVAGAATLRLLFSTLIAGTAVDYLGRRRVSLVSDALSGAAVTAVPVVAGVFGGHAVNVVVQAVLAGLGAAFDPAGMTARESMLPEASARAGWSLDRTNSGCAPWRWSTWPSPRCTCRWKACCFRSTSPTTANRRNWVRC